MRSRSKRVVVALFALSLIAAAINIGRPVSAALTAAGTPGQASPPQLAGGPRQLRGAEASQFLRESGISDSLDAVGAGGYVEQGKLLASDGIGLDSFSFSVAISGDTAVVGAPADMVGSNPRQGSAYVYTRTGSTWTQQQKLTAADGIASDEFGYAVATSGDTVFVGRHFTQVAPVARTRGAVYVYTRAGATWTQHPTPLVSSDIADSDLFGASLAYDNGTLVVGALLKNSGATFFRGAAYVFTGAGAAWTEQAKLLANDGGFADYFGHSVAVSGDTAIIAAPGQFGAGAASGRGWAYVFKRNGAAWSQQQKLQASDGAAGDAFGYSVGVSGDYAVIGARADAIGTNGEIGSAYIFARSGAVWAEQQKLTAQEPTPRNDFFGNGVAIKNDTVVVGSPAHEILPGIANHGAVYVFTRSGAAWTRQQKLIHSDASADALGQALAFDGSSIIAGAPFKDSSRGAAYVFADAGGGQTPATVQFSSATAAVAEGFSPPPSAGGDDAAPAANSVTVNVTRAGDTTGTTFVRYAPAAADGSVGCAATNGTALPRCDYTAATGTLRFDPGQTEKAVRVFVTDDSFSEGQETFALVLSAPLGATLGARSSVTVTVGDNDATPNGPNPIDGHGFFVHTQYTDFLSRPPEPSGYQAWLNVLNNCPNATNDATCDRVTVASSFFRSQEYEIKGFSVFRFYKVAFGRRPLYVEFAADLSRLSGDTAEEVNAARAAFPAEFAARDEFRARYDALPNAAYVDALIQTAGVDLGTRRQQLKDNLAAGTLTRAGVLREVVESQEVIAKEYHAGFVAALYFGFLGRDPEPGGYENWLNYLNANPTDFRTMVTGFVNSVEYRLRFGKAD